MCGKKWDQELWLNSQLPGLPQKTGTSIPPSSGNRGVGLGLTIVKKYLELIQGTIQVKSEAGKGSVFTVILPTSLEA